MINENYQTQLSSQSVQNWVNRYGYGGRVIWWKPFINPKNKTARIKFAKAVAGVGKPSTQPRVVSLQLSGPSLVSLKGIYEQQSARWEDPGSNDELNNTMLNNTHRQLLGKPSREIVSVWACNGIKIIPWIVVIFFWVWTGNSHETQLYLQLLDCSKQERTSCMMLHYTAYQTSGISVCILELPADSNLFPQPQWARALGHAKMVGREGGRNCLNWPSWWQAALAPQVHSPVEIWVPGVWTDINEVLLSKLIQTSSDSTGMSESLWTWN